MGDGPGPSGHVAPVADAATVILLRRGRPDGAPQVLLLERSRSTAAFAGAFVYPGGKVDDGDRAIDPALTRCRDPRGRAEQLRLGSSQQAIGFLTAAVRETFEECGILLAEHVDGRPVTDIELASDGFAAARQRLTSRDLDWDWHGWLHAEELVLDLDALHPWDWWLTPPGRPRRFDTRFFVVEVPELQTAMHDGAETTSQRWLSPRAALEGERGGELHLRPATIDTLLALAVHASVDEILEAARTRELGQRPSNVEPPTGDGPDPTACPRPAPSSEEST